jgi:hypothetical protein
MMRRMSNFHYMNTTKFYLLAVMALSSCVAVKKPASLQEYALRSKTQITNLYVTRHTNKWCYFRMDYFIFPPGPTTTPCYVENFKVRRDELDLTSVSLLQADGYPIPVKCDIDTDISMHQKKSPPHESAIRIILAPPRPPQRIIFQGPPS